MGKIEKIEERCAGKKLTGNEIMATKRKRRQRKGKQAIGNTPARLKLRSMSIASSSSPTRARFTKDTVEGRMILAVSPGSSSSKVDSVLTPSNSAASSPTRTPPSSCRHDRGILSSDLPAYFDQAPPFLPASLSDSTQTLPPRAQSHSAADRCPPLPSALRSVQSPRGCGLASRQHAHAPNITVSPQVESPRSLAASASARLRGASPHSDLSPRAGYRKAATRRTAPPRGFAQSRVSGS